MSSITETPTIIPSATNLPIIVIQKKKIIQEPIIHKFIDIKPVTIPEDQTKKLDRFINYYTRLHRGKSKYPSGIPEDILKDIKYIGTCMKKAIKLCTHCNGLSEYEARYDCQGAILVDRYCKACLDREKEKIERDY